LTKFINAVLYHFELCMTYVAAERQRKKER